MHNVNKDLIVTVVGSMPENKLSVFPGVKAQVMI